MSWVAAAIGGSALIGAGASMYGSNKASDASSNANKNIRRDLAPYKYAGYEGLNQYQNALANYNPDPFKFNLENDEIYQFQRDEGINAATRRMNALGSGNSGNILDELQRRGTGIAGQYQDQAFGRQLNQHNTNYLQDQNVMDRYFNLAGMGQNAAAQTGVAGMQNARNQGDAAYYQAGGVNNAIQGSIGNALTYNYLNQPYQGYGSTPATSGTNYLDGNAFSGGNLGGYGG